MSGELLDDVSGELTAGETGTPAFLSLLFNASSSYFAYVLIRIDIVVFQAEIDTLPHKCYKIVVQFQLLPELLVYL